MRIDAEFPWKRDVTESVLRRSRASRRRCACPSSTPSAAANEALAYRLVSRWTNCLVVVERAEGEKAGHLPELRKVKQTLAAGWGGVGRTALLVDFLACAPVSPGGPRFSMADF